MLRATQIVDVERRRDDLAVQRRHDHLDALALDARQVEDVLLRRKVRGYGRRTRRRAAQLVDELVDAGTAYRGGRRAAEEPTPREAHQPSGRTSTRPASNLSRFFTTALYVYGVMTCSLTV